MYSTQKKGFVKMKIIVLIDNDFIKRYECDLNLEYDYFFSFFFTILRLRRSEGNKNEPVAQNNMPDFEKTGKMGLNFEDYSTIHSHFLRTEKESKVNTVLLKF